MTAAAGHAWRSFRLVPDDLLFFRDGKPSSLGDDHYLRSVFPPYPFTLYGAVRSRRLIDERIDLRALNRDAWAALPEELRAELGPWGGFGTLELRGPWLVREGEVLLPAPLDLAVRLQSASSGAPRVAEVFRLHSWTSDPGEASHGLGPLRYHPEPAGSADPEPPRGWWIRPEGLEAWQDAELPEPDHLVHQSELWIDEPRTGVGLQEDRRSGKEGLIYTFGFIRLRPGVALGFDLRGGDLQPDRRLRIGGEGRTAWLEEGPPLPAAPSPAAPGQPARAGLRIALATPALWESGALPPDAGDAAGPILDGAAIRTAVVPGSIPVGGWDLAQARPKPMQRAVPAGSVFCLDAESPQAAIDLAIRLHGSNLSTYPDENLARQGFGLAIAGFASQEANDG